MESTSTCSWVAVTFQTLLIPKPDMEVPKSFDDCITYLVVMILDHNQLFRTTTVQDQQIHVDNLVFDQQVQMDEFDQILTKLPAK